MDRKQSKPKTKIMRFIPRAASAVIFHNPSNSPGREKRPVAGPVFPGPVNSGSETPEPISPKVSCMGQIKNKKKKAKELAAAAVETSETKKRRSSSAIKRILTGGVRVKLNVAAAPVGKPPLPPKRAPGLSQMKRFASGRGPLADFDWAAQIVPADVEGEQPEDGGDRSPVWIGEEVGPLQPRKEVNIWKRRTAVPPTPLQLNPIDVKQK